MGKSALKKAIGPRYEGLRVSREEYLDLEDDGYLYDMMEGVLYLTPSGTFEHGTSYGEFFRVLGNFLKKNPLGRITLETDILLPDGGDVLRPDLSFILNENLNIVKKHIHGAPDLICESLSDSTAERDLGEKANRYLACGVKEFWILDPRVQSIRVRYSRDGAWEEHSGNVLESRLLPGFRIDNREFWE